MMFIMAGKTWEECTFMAGSPLSHPQPAGDGDEEVLQEVTRIKRIKFQGGTAGQKSAPGMGALHQLPMEQAPAPEEVDPSELPQGLPGSLVAKAAIFPVTRAP